MIFISIIQQSTKYDTPLVLIAATISNISFMYASKRLFFITNIRGIMHNIIGPLLENRLYQNFQFIFCVSASYRLQNSTLETVLGGRSVGLNMSTNCIILTLLIECWWALFQDWSLMKGWRKNSSVFCVFTFMSVCVCGLQSTLFYLGI